MRDLYILPGVTLPKEGKPEHFTLHHCQDITDVPKHDVDIVVPFSLWKHVVGQRAETNASWFLFLYVPDNTPELEAEIATYSTVCQGRINQWDSWGRIQEL